MPANFEAGFFTKTPAWHGLGVVIPEPLLSEEAITVAGLDWTVTKCPIHVPTPSGDVAHPKEWVATVREDNSRVLGVVGPGYQVVQNADAFTFMDEVAGPGKLVRYETAGSLAFGRKVWMLATIADLQIEPIPGDVVKPYLLLANGHDGRMELSVCWTSVRVVCQNTLMLALRQAREKFSLRHTEDIYGKKEQAREVLGMSKRVVQEYEEITKRLAYKQMGDKAIETFLKSLVPNPTDRSPTRAENVRDMLGELIESGPGTDIPGVRGTAWGALNAVTAYTNHHRTVRGGSKNEGQEKKLESLWWGSANQMNQKAVELLLAV